MRPLAVLNGIILGCSASIMIGLAVTLFIYWVLLDDYPQRLSGELGPLIRYTSLFVAVTALASAGFVGQILDKRWKWIAEIALLAGLVATGWYFLG